MIGLIDPIANPLSWMVYYIGGVQCPGVIPPSGVSGFRRESSWDKKKGKGVKGGVLTLLQRPPAEGSIKVVITRSDQFSALYQFIPLLKYDSDKSQAQAITIAYPPINFLGINSVVVDWISPVEHVGKGKYTFEVKFIEWFPPPSVSIVSTPTTAKPTADPDIPGFAPTLSQLADQQVLAGLQAIP